MPHQSPRGILYLVLWGNTNSTMLGGQFPAVWERGRTAGWTVQGSCRIGVCIEVGRRKPTGNSHLAGGRSVPHSCSAIETWPAAQKTPDVRAPSVIDGQHSQRRATCYRGLHSTVQYNLSSPEMEFRFRASKARAWYFQRTGLYSRHGSSFHRLKAPRPRRGFGVSGDAYAPPLVHQDLHRAAW